MVPILKDSSYYFENTPGVLSKAMFYYIQSGGHFNCAEGYSTARKDYSSILLVYTLNGEGYLKYKGRNYSVQKGQAFIIDCMEHQYYSIGDGGVWEFKYIHFNGSESRKYIEKIYENIGPIISLHKYSVIPTNIDKILSMGSKGNKRLDILASCLVVEILTELLLISYGYDNKSSLFPWYIEKAILKIEKEYNNKINLDDFAKEINVNKFHLTKQFKKYTDQSLYEYLINYRLNASKKLLKTSNIPISEIAEQIGFESVSHYIKTFKENEGTTPLKFRKYWT